MASLPSSSSSSSITYSFTYDVFLSFRGSDTRYSFTGNLHKTLSDKGIHTFIDDKNLNRGDEITPTLIKAIQESRILIPIFSVNYASSSFCLDELVTIMECAKTNGRLVFPVFYGVDPSHIRHQRGTYAEALTKHEKRFQDNKEKLKRLQKWKTALNQAADLSGSHFKPSDESYEHEFIGKIVNEVSRKINRVALHIADYPVGLESQVLEVISLLDVGSHDRVHMVGIHGTGGIGKTTLALAVYNSIADHFEGLCFLENVRENYDKHGLLYLQKVILLDILGDKQIVLTNVNQGISIIQHRLQQKTVLLILDDVDKEEQLHGIAGRPDWFGPGSRVIITTRDKHLLAPRHGVERTYVVKQLKKEDAIEFLKLKAFKNDTDKSSYVDILNRVVTYASGLPLALEVIGSNLYGKSIQEWESALQEYEMIPNEKIQKILKVSYDALEEKGQNVFLDIACCFKGYHLKEVEDILHAHYDRCIKYQIGVLVDKSLIKINPYNKFITLHDLIEDMGKEIVRQESPNDPGKRSRLWSHEDIVEVLEEKTGTNEIEMICLDFPLREEVECDGKAFKKMKSLRTLIIKRVHFSKGPDHLPNSLRVMEWWKYPSKHLPQDFHPRKLSIWKLPSNFLTSLELLNPSKGFVNLKVLRLEECEHLTHIHDISSVLNLEEFSFKGCVNLITIHNSVGLLNKLKILDARNCPKLRSVPPLKLPLLKDLGLSGCSSLESFPELLEKMENISSLNLRDCYIRKLPSSFQNLTRLWSLNVNLFLTLRSFATIPVVFADFDDEQQQLLEILKDEGEEKVSSMLLYSKVERLYLIFLGDWRIRGDRFVALVLSYFDNLKELNLSLGNMTSVPECIKECRYLWKLHMDGCPYIREIKAIPPSLKYLSMQECYSLNFSSRTMLLKQELHEPGGTYFRIPSPEEPKQQGSVPFTRLPNWFEYRSSKGQSPSTFSFWFRHDFPDNILLCVAASPRSHAVFYGIHITINDNKYIMRLVHVLWPGHTCLRHLKVNYVADARSEIEWNHAEIMVEKLYGKQKTQVIADIGIHLLKEKGSTDNIRFINPDCEENESDDESSNYDNAPYLDFDSDSWPSRTHSGVEENEDETLSEDFNSEWSLSSTNYDVEENERDECFKY